MIQNSNHGQIYVNEMPPKTL
uniref:Uncharacterized protein n=1 Tax=Rhizophora mucronata TaxID=61149 RepID=A0A2P2Q8C8_RHIMU